MRCRKRLPLITPLHSFISFQMKKSNAYGLKEKAQNNWRIIDSDDEYILKYGHDESWCRITSDWRERKEITKIRLRYERACWAVPCRGQRGNPIPRIAPTRVRSIHHGPTGYADAPTALHLCCSAPAPVLSHYKPSAMSTRCVDATVVCFLYPAQEYEQHRNQWLDPISDFRFSINADQFSVI